MNDLLARLKQRLVTIVKRRPVLAHPEVRRKTMRLGEGYNAWTVDPTLINAQSVVYSFGVGEDIGFDRGVVAKFGATVHAFDPTPKSIAWFKAQPGTAGLVLHEYGVAAHDGEVFFSAPRDSSHVSHTILTGVMDDTHRFAVPVKRLATIMAELGHTRIDLLKMDIEGAEYEVIDDLVKSSLRPAQLLVEFHHRFPTVGNEKTVVAIDALRKAGYRLFAVSPSAEEFSFVHADKV
jgi:FkbM family methyltransferase